MMWMGYKSIGLRTEVKGLRKANLSPRFSVLFFAVRRLGEDDASGIARDQLGDFQQFLGKGCISGAFGNPDEISGSVGPTG